MIYVNVVKTQALVDLQATLQRYFECQWGIGSSAVKHRAFTPHITVAFRDLSRDNFKQGWAEFQHKPFAAEFTVSTLTLLRHNGRMWGMPPDVFPSRDKFGSDRHPGLQACSRTEGSNPCLRPIRAERVIATMLPFLRRAIHFRESLAV